MPNITPTLLAVAAALAAILPAEAASAQQQEDPAPKVQVADVDALRERLSAWKLRTTTDAAWSDAWTELASLRDDAEAAALAAPKDEELRSLLSDLQARAILWAMRRGDTVAASEWIVALRLAAQEKSEDPRRTLSLAAAMTIARADVKRAAASLPAGAQRAALPKPAGHSEDIVIARAVRQAVTRGDSAFLSKLGARAAPTLADLALEMDGSPIPSGQMDPLKSLIFADVATALDVSLELLKRDEYLLEKAVVEALKEREAFTYIDVWVPIGENDWRLARPEWNQILEILMTPAEEASKETADIAVQFAMRGAVPRELTGACIDLLARDSRTPYPTVFPDAGLPYFRAMLRHPNAKAREAAARILRDSPYAEDLLDAAADPTAKVREIVAAAMDNYGFRVWSDASRTGRVDGPVQRMDPTPKFSAALTALVVDPDEGVRASACSAVVRQSEARESSVLSGATIRELLPVFDEERRSTLTSIIRWLPEAERLPTLVTYVEFISRQDYSPKTVSNLFEGLLDTAEYGLEPKDAFWPLVEAMERTVGYPRGLKSSVARSATYYVLNGQLSATRTLDWLEGQGTDEIWVNIVYNRLSGAPHSIKGHWVEKLTSPERARIVRLLAGRTLRIASVGNLGAVDNIRHGGFGIDVPDVIALMDDTSAHVEARRWAVIELAEIAPSELIPDRLPTFVAIYRDYSAGTLDSLWRNPEHPELALDVLDALLADPTVSDEWLLGLRIGVRRASTIENVLRRYPPETWTAHQNSRLLEKAVYWLVRNSPDAPDPRLASANIQRSKLQESLAVAIGQVRGDAYFPLLAEVLRESATYSDSYKAALDAVTSYLNDDAAALLLETAKRLTSREARQSVLERLDQITAYQDAAARWQRGRDAAAKRAEAVAELVAIYEDESLELSVRAEALRGLGLLGAVEELPRIIRAQTSISVNIRAAAKDALDRLKAEAGSEDDDR